ncbi:MAG: transaldolase family protein [Actinomycetota bacterium]|nr:transaldolase family protein [Actinomycetota bacterium]
MIPAIKVFTDASTIPEVRGYASEPWVSGFTTNPTLMRKGGVTNYREFAIEAIEAAEGKPLSLEVVADDLVTMTKQGLLLGSWGSNVNVKIPITTTSGQSCLPVVRELLDAGVDVNVTAMMTDGQVADLVEILGDDDAVFVSVFAGRIADAGIDPVPVMKRYAQWLEPLPKAELLWASPREVLNIVQAAECGCDIITVTPDLLRKLDLLGKDLADFSLETVRMFYDDALSAGLEIS